MIPGGPLDEEMATHSRILAWKITQTEESGRLQQHLGGLTGLDFQLPGF